ncbi:MAG: radical SAM protein [bacterium]|nr:radical SAM protein [bacterium]
MPHAPERILLISPRSSKDALFGRLKEFGNYKLPINLCNLAAMCRERGHVPRILDLNVSRPAPGELRAEIARFDPRWIGITAFTMDINSASRLARSIKDAFPRIAIIIGGVHLSSLPERTMCENPQFDYGVVGEGELTLVELLEAGIHDAAKAATIPGIIFRHDGSLSRTAPRGLIDNLDTLPFPAYDLVEDMDAYQPSIHRRSNSKSMMVITSRGCPMGCTFCDRTVLGRRYRSHSVPYVIDLMKHLRDRYAIRHFDIEDENMGLNAQWLHHFCDRLANELPGITWACSMRADLVTDDKLKGMRAAGCRNITFGIESGSQEMLDNYKKRLKVETIRTAVGLVKKNSIGMSGSFILGGAGETEKTMRESIKFLRTIDLDYFYLWYLAPVPGSEVAGDLDRHGQIASRNWDDYSGQKIVFIPRGLSERQLRKTYTRYYRAFYLRPSYIIRKLRSLSSARELKETARLALTFVRMLLQR